MTDEEAAKILNIARQCAHSYRQQMAKAEPIEAANLERCAVAASNTGWFILVEFGYSPETIRRILNEPSGLAEQCNKK